MCGLVGIVGGDWTAEGRLRQVLSMAETLIHRGPDGSGSWAGKTCALAFRRLSIVDLAAPSPPYASEDGSVRSVANAEIYNGDELRERLEAKGHRFRTRVDTEIVPHLYEEAGVGLVEALDGMFAIALWDEARARLLLARDRAGEKPLFYWQRDGQIVFASELRALLVHPGISAEVDPVGLRRFLTHDFFPAPLTPIAGVRKLPAGHLLVSESGQVAVRRYWDLADHFGSAGDSATDPARAALELDKRIASAVERRRKSDVAVGVFLSGGIDSTTVLAHMTEQAGRGVPVFSLGHSESGFDESGFAAETAKYYGANFHRLILGETELAEGLRLVGEGFDEPLGDASIIPTHLLSRFARQHVKVVLSGEGADELFAGYPTYLGHRLAAGYGRVPKPLRHGLEKVLRAVVPVSMGNVGLDYLLGKFTAAAGLDLVERHHTWFGSLPPASHHEILAPALLERLATDDPLQSARSRLEGRRFPDDLARLLYTDFTMYLQDGLLTKVDRCTMLASLEARAPFLDHDLAEFAAALPSASKVSGFKTKAILRRAESRRLPRGALTRRKRGFNTPFSRWLLHGLGDEMRQRFSGERVAARGLLSAQGVGKLLDEHMSRTADHRKPLFTLLVLDLWCDRVFGEGNPVPIAPVETGARASGLEPW